LYDRFTVTETKEGVQDRAPELSDEQLAFALFSGCSSRSHSVWKLWKQRPRHKIHAALLAKCQNIVSHYNKCTCAGDFLAFRLRCAREGCETHRGNAAPGRATENEHSTKSGCASTTPRKGRKEMAETWGRVWAQFLVNSKVRKSSNLQLLVGSGFLLQ